ncbi:MAG TPA: M50 family metallopeptidase [Symbiobacteriaceae bacterium]|nr:M50 family metallopeptidase [Symbiobacteriaceae bacterium]
MNPLSILWAILVFGVLIFIHELGHFGVAKFFGIRVKEFAIGFGPVLGSMQRGETRYSLRAVPLGGFVLMGGMEEGEEDDPRGYLRKPVYARFLTILAGPVMNFLLATLIFVSYFAIVPSQPTNTLGQVPEQCGAVTCPAYAAGLRAGDRVTAIGGAPVSGWNDLLALVGSSAGKPLSFQFERGGVKQTVTIAPIQVEGGAWRVGITPAYERISAGQALSVGVRTTYFASKQILSELGKVVTGRSKPEFQGPIGITVLIADQAREGLPSLLQLTAFLSINLGLFNLLPIPALDGSRLVFLTVEAIRGRRVDPRRESMVHLVGFLLLLGLMVVTAYGDIVRL